MSLFKECHGCTDRVVGCHSKCERYAREVEKNERIKAAKNADVECRAYAYKVKMERMAKQAMKKKHKVEFRRNGM